MFVTQELVKSMAELTPKQAKFVAEYLIDLNATQAAIRAGYSARTAEPAASRLLSNVKVGAAIAQAQKTSMDRLEMSADAIKKKLHEQAYANPNELSGWQIGCCRYCWGDNNLYQRTRAEMERDRETFETKLNRLLDSGDPKDAEKANRMGEFEAKGGIGFDPRKDTNPDCCECFGEGQGRPFIRDTRKLSPDALALYAGIEVTKDGVKIARNSQDSARMALAKHFGLLKDQVVHSFDFTGLTDEQLEQFESLLAIVSKVADA